MDIDALALRFSRDILVPVDYDDETGEATAKDGHVSIGLAVGFQVDHQGNFEFGVGTPPEDGEDLPLTGDSVALAISDPFWIGTSRVLLIVEDIWLRFSENGPRPSWATEESGAGVYIGRVQVVLPPDLGIPLLKGVGVRNLIIATGGFSGILEATWTQRLLDASEGQPARFEEGRGVGELFGMPFALRLLDFEIRQNSFARAGLHCDLIPPIIEKPLGLLLSIDADGKFAAEVRASDLLPEEADDSLIHLRQEGLLDLTVSSVRFELADDPAEEEGDARVGTFILAGSLKPLVAGIDWPKLEVEKLSINTEGEVDLEGGWIDVPETFSLDFHAFKIELDRIGFGKEGEGDAQRDWVGLSGGITLVEGLPLSASVNGLKVSWLPKPAPDPGVRVSIEGIAVSLEIPNTLKLEGAINYREIGRPAATVATMPEGDAAAGLYGHVFTGSINLEVTALNMAIGGELMVGELTPYHYKADAAGGARLVTGDSFVSLFIVLSVELPTAIPLGATDAGLYGIRACLG